MNRTPKILMTIASLLLVGVYFFPIWSIALDAPQYPEGLGLKIYINTVKGQTEHDLNKINNLNHYIGMKTIEPDSIPELSIMPWVIAGMILFGLIAAFSGKRSFMITWIILLILLGVAGLYDFYLWGYDYGHNLDPHAIIKVPGMAYQPPVFGTKKLLNFTARSYPAFGSILIGSSIAIAAIAVLISPKKSQA